MSLCRICMSSIDFGESILPCIMCGTKYHLIRLTSPNSIEKNWICQHCINSNLPFAERVYHLDKDNLVELIKSNLLSDKYLDPIALNDDGRMLLNEEGLDADINYFNSTSNYSCMYKDLGQFLEFSECLQHKNQLSIVHLNCLSMINKIHEIGLLLTQTNPSIMVLMETWLSNDIETLTNIPGHRFIHRSRKVGQGGGVGFLIRSDVDLYTFNEVPGSSDDTFESLFIKLPQIKNTDIILGAMYRPPGNSIPDFLKDFNNTLLHLSNSKKKVFLSGDYNINILRYNDHHSTGMSLNTLASYKFMPTILRPTRITAFSATLIDNIFTNCPNYNMDSCILIDDISDHLPIMLCIDLFRTTSRVSTTPNKRIFNDKGKDALKQLLQITDWSTIEQLADSEGPDVAYASFISKYISPYDLAFPITTSAKVKKSNGPKQPWMSTALLKSCSKKSKLYKKYLKNPTTENRLKFTQYRNKFKLIRKECESRYHLDRFSECTNNLTKTWKVINQILNSKGDPGLPDSFKLGDRVTLDKFTIANALNDYFTNIGPTLANKIPCTSKTIDARLTPHPPTCSFGLLPTSSLEVKSVAALLRTSVSTGPDDINPSIAISTIDIVAAPLASIINSSFQYGLVPADLKIAKITPIFKAGDKNLITNYRPISV